MTPSFQPGGRGRVAVAVLVALGALLILARLLVNLFVEVLWHAEVEHQAVFWTRIVWSLGTRVVVGVLVGALVVVNLRIVARTLSGIQIKRRFGNLEISEQLPRSYVLWATLGLSALLGLWFGGSVSADTGVRLLLAIRSGTWGVVDPVLGRDLSFYVFDLPLMRAGVTFALITTFLLFTVCVGAYAATGSVKWGQRGVVMGDQARVHLGSLVALFVLLMGLQFLLGRYVLLQYGGSGVQGIFGYTDARARMPGLTAMAALSALAAGLVFWGSLRNRMIPVAAGLGMVIVGGLAIVQIWPAFIQRFRVEPNELARESLFIRQNIDFTRLGFGLAEMERRSFDYARPSVGIDWDEAADQFDGIPVWTTGTLLTTFRELEARFPYYDFSDVALDRYPVAAAAAGGPAEGPARGGEVPVQGSASGGAIEPVAISVREIDPAGVGDQNWQNRHIRERYITGMGAVAAPAAERTPEGRPPMYLSGIPPESAGRRADPALRLTQPRVYVSATPQRYAIINASDTAFLDEAGSPGTPGRDFPAGIRLSSLARTIAFAWRFRDANLLFAGEVTDASRFVFRRQVAERAQSVAPFFHYPEAPYPVVHEGRIVWILEGFTASRQFPLSTPRALGWRRPASYVRNSVRVTVDAVTGEMRFYALPDEDPLLDAYREAFPGLVRPLEEMPLGLRTHLRYPRSLLHLQGEVLLQYHQETVAQFHGQQDVWARPRELSRTTTPVDYVAEYGIYRMPGDETDDFWLTTAFVPVGRQNLTGITAGRLLPDGTRQLLLWDVALEDQAPGPRQVEALVEQDPEISQQFSLWRTGGSQVWTGHLHLVPVGRHILYMEPVFLAAEADAIPQLRGFVVSDGNRVVMEPTLPLAVAAISGELPPDRVSSEGASADSGPADTLAQRSPPIGEWPREALEMLDRAESRLRDGDYQGFGEALTELRRLLEDLAAPATGGPPNDPGLDDGGER